jgi:hypothetical protein
MAETPAIDCLRATCDLLSSRLGMVKYIRAIEFIEDYKTIGQG